MVLPPLPAEFGSGFSIGGPAAAGVGNATQELYSPFPAGQEWQVWSDENYANGQPHQGVGAIMFDMGLPGTLDGEVLAMGSGLATLACPTEHMAVVSLQLHDYAGQVQYVHLDKTTLPSWLEEGTWTAVAQGQSFGRLWDYVPPAGTLITEHGPNGCAQSTGGPHLHLDLPAMGMVVDGLAYDTAGPEIWDYVASTNKRRSRPVCDGQFATLVGTSGDDILTGTPGADVIIGLEGNDTIDGMGGDDVICGNGGDDEIQGGDGHDTMFGGEGNDTIRGGAGNDRARGQNGNDRVDGGPGNDNLNGNNGDDIVNGQDGNDYVSGRDGYDTVTGGTGDDTIYGGGKSDILKGGEGDDTMWANAFADHLEGGKGHDTMSGGDGPDKLIGGPGDDYLDGNRGNDTLWGGNDTDTCNGRTGWDEQVNCENLIEIP